MTRIGLFIVGAFLFSAPLVSGQQTSSPYSVKNVQNGVLRTDPKNPSEVTHMDPIRCKIEDSAGTTAEVEVLRTGRDPLTAVNATKFTISSPGVDDLGKYYCEVKADPSFSVEVNITGIVGKPPDSSMSTSDGKDVTFECHFDSFPTHVTKWYFGKEKDGDKSLLATDGRFTVDGDKLVVKEVGTNDRGYYYCTATNSATNTTMKTFLRVRSKLAPLWPFIGIVIQVILLVLIIFLCDRHKQGQKAAKERKEANGTDRRAGGAGEGTSQAVRRRN